MVLDVLKPPLEIAVKRPSTYSLATSITYFLHAVLVICHLIVHVINIQLQMINTTLKSQRLFAPTT